MPRRRTPKKKARAQTQVIEAEVVEAEIVDEPTALAVRKRALPERRTGSQSLFEVVVATLSPNTRKAYQQDIQAFGAWWGSADPLRDLISFEGPGEAREVVLSYQAHLKNETQVSGATIARRLRALNSMVKKLNFAEYVPWKLDVPVAKIEALKDVRGPGTTKWKKLLRSLKKDERWFGPRDLLMVRLMGNDNLRASEVGALRVREDIRVVEGRTEIFIHGKGAKNLWHPIHPHTKEALEAWLDIREELLEEEEDEVVWLVFSQRRQRIGGKRVWERIQKRAEEAGIGSLHPHALRHFAITQKAKNWDGPQSALVSWARHSDANTTQRYIDDVKDEVYRISQLGDDEDD